jgi:2-keto-3-deoxy-L-rhamnonate aldolase RhmA
MARTGWWSMSLWLSLLASGGCGAGGGGDETVTGSSLAVLWAEGIPAFGVFVPDERPRDALPSGGPRPAPLYTDEGAAALARNPLYDFLFLNLEGGWDAGAVQTLAGGIRGAEGAGPRTLLVRIPSISRDGEEAARARVREVLEAGADGVVLPHVRSAEEARLAVSFFQEAGADVWSPSNPGGTVIAMLMLEDPDAVSEAGEIADVGGFSVLACGIGSYTAALGGDREAAEAGNLSVLAEARRVGMADMITADPGSVERRIQEGFLALLMSGPAADEAIRIGRAAAGR